MKDKRIEDCPCKACTGGKKIGELFNKIVRFLGRVRGGINFGVEP